MDEEELAIQDELIAVLELDKELMQPMTNLLLACRDAAFRKGVDPTLVIASQLSNGVVSIRMHMEQGPLLELIDALATARLRMLETGHTTSVPISGRRTRVNES